MVSSVPFCNFCLSKYIHVDICRSNLNFYSISLYEYSIIYLSSYWWTVSFFKKLINLFIVGCVGSSLLRAGFLQLRRVEATLRCGARASHCSGFSCCRAWVLGVRASVVKACGLTSCGAQAQLLHDMWDLPGPGIEPMSPALAGGFLTTVPPGRSQVPFFSLKYSYWNVHVSAPLFVCTRSC